MTAAPGGLDVLALGELNPDFILTGITAYAPVTGVEQAFARPELTLGSSTAITCVLLQRLGVRTALRAIVGNDDHGRFCRAAIAAEGVDAALVETSPRVPTGLTVCLPYPTDRLLLTCQGTMALDASVGVDAATLGRFRHLHVGSFYLQAALRPRLAQLFRTARETGLTTSLDTGWDPEEAWLDDDLRAVLEQTSVLLPNASELAALSGIADPEAATQRLLDFGVEAVAAKLGADGAIHADRTGIVRHDGFAANPVDTTGAGDAFNAGYLAAMLAGEAPPARLALGNACGALTVAAVGGTGGLRDLAQARALTG